VEAEILEAYLRRELSLEAIGKLTGRHPSTVGYWVKRHGLSAVHRDRHAPKGGIDKPTLGALVDEGLSTREIAARLGLSQSTAASAATTDTSARSSSTTATARSRNSGLPTGVSRGLSRP
jgi:IS30 family transposase